MTERKDNSKWVIGILLLLIFTCSVLLYLHLTEGAKGGENPEIGILTFKHKTIERKYDSDVIWNRIESGLVIRNKDTIRSGDFSDAVLTLKDNTQININENSKIYISGFVNPNKVVSSYNIPALNISNDRDIIIVSSGDNEIKKDFFTKNIALDLKIISKEIKYITKNIELKLDADLQIKKEFEEDLRIFGRVSNINGVFSQLGKTYKIENSNLQFRGLETINPILDIKANTKIDNVEIFIDITGNMENPRLNLKSNPSMNSKDILSYLIFGTKFSNSSMNEQNKEAQASLFILNELSKDYVKELGIDILHFDYDPKTQYIETTVGKKIGEKNQIIIKNKATNGELIFLRELTKLWNLQLGLMEKTQSIDLIYKKRY